MVVETPAAASTFQYTSLKDGEFRLLRIFPPKGLETTCPSDATHCELFVIARDEAKYYECLSYTWGTDDPEKVVYVNQIPYKVRNNLYDALQHLRLERKERLVWIDAICIDQTNPMEQKVQIPLMDKIYGNATSTFVWLGMADDSSDAAIAECKRIGGVLVSREIFDYFSGLPERKTNFHEFMQEFATLPSTDEFKDRNKYLEIAIQEQLEPFIAQAESNLSATLSFVYGMKALLSRMYWDRVWIRQEFVVTKELTIHCGKSYIGLPELKAAMFYITLMQHPILMRSMMRFSEKLTSGPEEIRNKLAAWVENGYSELENGSQDEEPEVRQYKDLRNDAWAIFEAGWNTFAKSTKALFGLRSRYHDFQNRVPGYDNAEFSLFRILAKVNIESTVSAKKQKDKVYGLLSMASDQGELSIPVKTEDDIFEVEVYTDTARALIHAGHVDLLSLAQHRPEVALPKEQESSTEEKPEEREPKDTQPDDTFFNKKEKKLLEFNAGPELGPTPSWVPDWRKKIVRPCGQLPWDTSFNVCHDRVFEQATDLACPSREIDLIGWVVDTITNVGTPWQPTDDDYYSNYTAMQRYMSEISEFCDLSSAIFASTGNDVYTNFPEATRASAYHLIPVADQEQYSVGFIRQAGANTELGHQEVVARVARAAMTDVGSAYVNMMSWQRFRTPFLCEKGYVGLVPDHSEAGDLVVVFGGAKFPYVLRRRKDEKYKLVGEGYVHGIMYGEFAKKVQKSERKVFRLI